MKKNNNVVFMTSPVGAEVKQGKTSPVFYEPLASNKKLVPQPFVPKSYLTRLGSTPPKIGTNEISKTDVTVGASIYASPLLSAKKVFLVNLSLILQR